MTVTIYGSSDDLIEIEGDIEEEFNVYEDTSILAFSDGTLLRAHYDKDGIWRLTLIVAGNAQFHKEEGSVKNDTPDVVHLTHLATKWVVLGKQYALQEPYD